MKEDEKNLIDIIKYEVLGGSNSSSGSDMQVRGAKQDCRTGENQVRGARPDIPVSAELYTLARHHEVAQLVADFLGCTNVKKEAPNLAAQKEAEQKFRAEIAEHYNAELYRALTFKTDLSRVSLILERAGIDFIPLKGAIIRDFYPKNWMRSSTDIDILVRQEDLSRAVSAITSEPGYMLVNKTDHHTLIESKTGWIIEVHFTLSQEENDAKSPGSNGAKKLLDRAWDFAAPVSATAASAARATASDAPDRATHRYNFTDEFFEFYFYYHLAHHARKQGALGIRQMLDVFILAARTANSGDPSGNPDESTHRAARAGNSARTAKNPLLEKSGLSRFAATTRTIARVWFGDLSTKKAAKELGISEEEFEEVETFALDGGLTGSPESKKTMQKLTGRRRTMSDQLGRLTRIFRPGAAAKIKKEIELAATIGDNEVDRARRVMKNLGL